MMKLSRLLIGGAALLVSSLVVQQFLFATFTQVLILRTEPALFNPFRAFLGSLIGFWDQRMSWQGGGEAGFFLLSGFGVSAGLLRRSWSLRWVPLVLGAAYFVFLVGWVGTVTETGSPMYWENLAWRVSALLLVAANGVLVDRWLRKRWQAEDGYVAP